MVRLIVFFRSKSNPLEQGFNSKMVRLIDVCRVKGRTLARFQFQNGSINSSLPIPLDIRTNGFNSKMVRLIAETVKLKKTYLRRFNSKMVRLIGGI